MDFQTLFAHGDLDFDEALKKAAGEGNLAITKLLTGNGATDLNGAMATAAGYERLEVVKYLAANGATDINSAMHGAAEHDSLEVVQWLAANGATNIDEAVGVAAGSGALDVVKWLAANGASCYLNDAVEEAAYQGHLYVVKWLAFNHATDLDGAKFNAERDGYSEIVRWINAFCGLQAFKKAVRAWLIINYWIKQVGKRQYAPTAAGGKRYIAELEHVGEQLPELIVVEAFGELGVLSNTKGKRPRSTKCHKAAPQTFDCGTCGCCVIECIDCGELICTGCDDDDTGCHM